MDKAAIEKHLADTDLFKILREYPSAFKDMFATKGWECWVQWAKQKGEEFKKMALDGPTPEVREENRILYLALELFCNYPEFLATLQTPEASPADSPQAQAEGQE